MVLGCWGIGYWGLMLILRLVLVFGASSVGGKVLMRCLGFVTDLLGVGKVA